MIGFLCFVLAVLSLAVQVEDAVWGWERGASTSVDGFAAQAAWPCPTRKQRSLVLCPAITLVPVYPSGSYNRPSRDAHPLAPVWLSLHPMIFECGGPRVYSYEEFLRAVAHSASLEPILIPIPFAAWQSADMDLRNAPESTRHSSSGRTDADRQRVIAGDARVWWTWHSLHSVEEILQKMLSVSQGHWHDSRGRCWLASPGLQRSAGSLQSWLANGTLAVDWRYHCEPPGYKFRQRDRSNRSGEVCVRRMAVNTAPRRGDLVRTLGDEMGGAKAALGPYGQEIETARKMGSSGQKEELIEWPKRTPIDPRSRGT